MALTKKAGEYEDVKKTLLHLQERLKGVHAMSVQPGANGSGNTQLRELPVEVSAGMIRQNLLTLTKHVKQHRIKLGEELTIEAQPSGERFRTQLLEKGNKLRERGAITRFYRDAGVHSGDFVVLTETAALTPPRVLNKGGLPPLVFLLMEAPTFFQSALPLVKFIFFFFPRCRFFQNIHPFFFFF